MTDITTALREVVGLVEEATPGEMVAHPARPKHITTITAGRQQVAFTTNDNRGIDQQNDDAEAFAAAVNFIRTHGAALQGMVADAERLDWMERDLHELSWDRNGNRVCVVGSTGANIIGKRNTLREVIDAAMRPDHDNS